MKMVYYFTSNSVDPPVTLYMGKDKFESMCTICTQKSYHRVDPTPQRRGAYQTRMGRGCMVKPIARSPTITSVLVVDSFCPGYATHHCNPSLKACSNAVASRYQQNLIVPCRKSLLGTHLCTPTDGPRMGQITISTSRRMRAVDKGQLD